MTVDGPIWLNTKAAAEYTGYSVHTIRDAAERGDLSGCKPGGYSSRRQWRFRTSDLDEWMERGRVGQILPPHLRAVSQRTGSRPQRRVAAVQPARRSRA